MVRTPQTKPHPDSNPSARYSFQVSSSILISSSISIFLNFQFSFECLLDSYWVLSWWDSKSILTLITVGIGVLNQNWISREDGTGKLCFVKILINICHLRGFNQCSNVYTLHWMMVILISYGKSENENGVFVFGLRCTLKFLVKHEFDRKFGI